MNLPSMEEAAQFMRILSKNSPVRDEAGTRYEKQYTDKNGETKIRRWKMPKEIKRHGVVISPYPGNLMNNGTRFVEMGNLVEVYHGYSPAVYALAANKNSRKPGYIQKSEAEFFSYLAAEGWEEVFDYIEDFDE